LEKLGSFTPAMRLRRYLQRGGEEGGVVDGDDGLALVLVVDACSAAGAVRTLEVRLHPHPARGSDHVTEVT
jgi:hypothetical protein